MLELKILSANVLLPVVILGVTLLAIRWSRKRDERISRQEAPEPAAPEPAALGPAALDQDQARVGDKIASTVLILAAVAAIWLAFGLRVGFSLWPEDAWARLPHSVAIVGLGSAVAVWIPISMSTMKALAWAIRLGSLLVAAKIVIPTGEAWEFLRPTENAWWAILVFSPLVSWWFIDRQSSRIAAAYGFGTIACIAAGAFLSSEFLRVTEPLLALASVVGCASVATWGARSSGLVSAVFGPSVFGMGAAVASAQFNSYAGKPDSLSWLAISAPALAALLLLMIVGGKKRSTQPTRKMLTVIVLVCSAIAACVVTWTLIAGASAGDDEWSIRRVELPLAPAKVTLTSLPADPARSLA